MNAAVLGGVAPQWPGSSASRDPVTIPIPVYSLCGRAARAANEGICPQWGESNCPVKVCLERHITGPNLHRSDTPMRLRRIPLAATLAGAGAAVQGPGPHTGHIPVLCPRRGAVPQSAAFPDLGRAGVIGESRKPRISPDYLAPLASRRWRDCPSE